MSSKPWIAGPKELLDHAAAHIGSGSDFDYRIAFISIDSAVEVMIRTYLGLPRRARGSAGPAREKLEATRTFPGLLDLLEEHFGDRLEGIDLGDLEWYHRTRNMLYHAGNGITVARDQVEGYLEVAKLLFKNLFGEPIDTEEASSEVTAIGRFMLRWSQIETNLALLDQRLSSRRRTVNATLGELVERELISSDLAERVRSFARARHSLVHGSPPPQEEFEGLLSDMTEVVLGLSNAASRTPAA